MKYDDIRTCAGEQGQDLAVAVEACVGHPERGGGEQRLAGRDGELGDPELCPRL